MSKKELRIGVIGAGGRGRMARQAHRPDEGSRLVAGADTQDKALDEFKEFCGPDTMVTHDYREVLARDDVDAVFVTTPDFLHEEHALAAIEAGKAVYLEKPMTITIEGCDRVLRAAMEQGVRLYVGHNMRHMAAVQKMKELIEDGAIGEPKTGWCRHFVGYGGDAYFKDWHAERAKSTSLLLQKAAHDIDVLHWLCAGYSRRVTGMGGLTLYDKITDRHDPSERGDATFRIENWPPLSQKGLNPTIDVEDISMMLMELDNGVFCSYTQCHFTPDSWRNFTIIGDRGRIENVAPDVIRVWDTRVTHCPYGDYQFNVKPGRGGHGGSDTTIVGEFLRFLREGGHTINSPVAARQSVAAGCQAAWSMRNGNQPGDIPPVEADVLAHYEREHGKGMTLDV